MIGKITQQALVQARIAKRPKMLRYQDLGAFPLGRKVKVAGRS